MNPEEDPTKQEAPSDALSRTPDELEGDSSDSQGENSDDTASTTQLDGSDDKKIPKPPSKLKKFFKKINLYFLLFLLVLAIGAAVTTVYYLNSRKTPEVPNIANQDLSEDALKELSNKNISVGDKSQTLTIKGSAVINGQALVRGGLNVAGNLQAGGSIQGSGLTISGSSNLNDVQINSLQVAQNTAIQGNTTLRDLNVAGASTFSGALTASQISVSRLILSGNATLQIPNHLSFTGPSPSRSINGGVLGAGGSASVNGSDTSGTVNINTGNNPSAGCFMSVNFNSTFSTRPKVIVSPVGVAAGRVQFYVERNVNNFSICTSAPAPANQSFAFDYFVAG